MSKRDNWEDYDGEETVGHWIIQGCKKHDFDFYGACPECFAELEQENERLKAESQKNFNEWQKSSNNNMKLMDDADELKESFDVMKRLHLEAENDVKMKENRIQELEKESQNLVKRLDIMRDDKEKLEQELELKNEHLTVNCAVTIDLRKELEARDKQIAELQKEVESEKNEANYYMMEMSREKSLHGETKILLAGYFKTLNKREQQLARYQELVDKLKECDCWTHEHIMGDILEQFESEQPK